MAKRQKLRGALLAYAIGDTLGKGTEFMELAEIKHRYPSGLRKYSDIYQDSFRSQWAPGEWTNDTVVLLNMANAIIADQGALLVRHQAKVLMNWYEENPVDVAANMRWVFSEPGYTENPLETAAKVWDKMKHLHPTNESLGCSMLAALAPGDPETNARTICLLTHADSRCATSAAVLGRIAHDLLHHDRITPRSNVMELAMKSDPSLVPFLKIAYNGELADLELDDPDTMADSRKAIASAIWVVNHSKNASDALYSLTNAGGDSDSNAALGAAIVAIRDGGELNMESHLVEELNDYRQILSTADRLADTWNFDS